MKIINQEAQLHEAFLLVYELSLLSWGILMMNFGGKGQGGRSMCHVTMNLSF